MNVCDFTQFSDHCPINCAFFINFCRPYDNSLLLDPLPGKFIWINDALSPFNENMQSNTVKNKFTEFMNTSFEDCEAITNSFNSILIDCAKQSAKFVKKYPRKKNKSKVIKKPWFSQSCSELKNSVTSYLKLVNKSPESGHYRKMYYTYKSKYRRLCKYEEKEYKNNLFTEISNNIDKNPKTFWNLVNKLDRMNNKSSQDDDIPHQDFLHFFQKLNKADKSNNELQKNIIHNFEQAMKKLDDVNSDDDIFNSEITV